MLKHMPLLACLALLILASRAPAEPPAQPTKGAVVWTLNNLDTVAGHKTTRLGSPKLIDTPNGKAVEFDGKGDALFLETNPLAGLKAFTAEVVFRPDADGPKEQRFLHFQERGSEDRLLFETRLTPDGRWFLDTYIQTGEGKHTLYAEKSLHPIGPWYQAAVTCDGKTMRHYVNGTEELSAAISYKPQGPGDTSIGVRFNKVFWFQGAIRQIRITPAVLEPKEFLKP